MMLQYLRYCSVVLLMNEVKRILDERGISIRAFAKVTGIRPCTLTKYLDAEEFYYKKGYLHKYWQMANALEVPVEELLIEDGWNPTPDIIRKPITIAHAVELRAKEWDTSILDMHNRIRKYIGIPNDYLKYSGYENYRWCPPIPVALKLAKYLNCTIDALWGEYFKRGINNDAR